MLSSRLQRAVGLIQCVPIFLHDLTDRTTCSVVDLLCQNPLHTHKNQQFHPHIDLTQGTKMLGKIWHGKPS